MKYLRDFRFVIGLFFAMVSLILAGAGWVTGNQLNWIASGYTAVTAFLMLGVGARGAPEQQEIS